MKILSIRFENLNSLRGAHVVNLEDGPLASAGLFAITGPTGAGKSTILDAITLALYGRAARYGDSTAEDMMSRSEGECSASVDFECITGRYTAKWLLRRARGKAAGKIQPVVHELSQDGAIIEEKTQRVVKRVEKLTELDYDRFLRSVLLAQGQFAAFLRANRDERADLLERITGSHIYSELGSLAHHISSGHSRGIEDETNRMKGIVFLSEEERKKVSGRILELARELRIAEAKKTTLQSLVTAGRRAVELQRQLEALEALAAEHMKTEVAFAPEAARLSRHADTEPFAEALADLADASRLAATSAAASEAACRQAVLAKEKAAMAAGAAMACISNGESMATEEQRRIATQQEKNTVDVDAAREWLADHAADATLAGTLPQFSTLVAQAGFLASQCDAAMAVLAKARLEEAGAEEKRRMAMAQSADAAKQSELAHRSAEESRAALAALLTPPWTTAGAIEQEVNRLGGVLQTLTRLAGTHSALVEQEKKMAARVVEAMSMQREAAALAEAGMRARERLEAEKRMESLLRDRVADQRRIRSLEEHRAHLQTGQPCPLCGSVEHPWSGSAGPPVSDSEEQLRRQTEAVELLESAASTALAQATAAEKSFAEFQARFHAIEENLFSAKAVLEVEWRAVAPDRECTGENLAAARAAVMANHASMTTLGAKVRAAQEAEREAAAGAARAAAEAKLALTGGEVCAVNAARAATSVEEAGVFLTNVHAARVLHLTEARQAFEKAGETDPIVLTEAVERLQKRESTWREKTAALTELERNAASLQHAHEKSALAAKEWEIRRNETGASILKASLAPIPCPVPEGGWNAASASMAGSLTAFLTAEGLAAAAAETAEKSAKTQAARHASLKDVLDGSTFESVEALRGARLEGPVMASLTARRDALREEGIGLNARRETISREHDTLSVDLAQAESDSNTAGPSEDLHSRELALLQMTELVSNLHAERGGLEERLRSDDKTRTRHANSAASLEERKRTSAPWARLSELIGSAEGDKFSRFAQSITLDHLTTLANARLTQLCDRYRLLRSGTSSDLQLQICDGWQADSVRPVESLSGGESFLVSLALALGLSELAGRRTRIATLFIDEGFGTLDSTALDVALSALECLRTGHSAIGVISHVEALKARLTTQVEVSRGPGGWSTLNVRT